MVAVATLIGTELCNEATPANVIFKNPEYHLDGNTNVECVCGNVRYSQLEACRQCKSYEIAGFRVFKSEEVLLQSKYAIKKRFWYHSTTKDNWGKVIKSAGVPVHLGNKATSQQLAQDLHYLGGKKTYDLYKIMLNPFASISDVVCPDMVVGWSDTMSAFRSHVKEDYVRYVNTFENSGTISLLGNPRKFIIVDKTTHTA